VTHGGISPLPFCRLQKEVCTNRYYDIAIFVFLCMEDIVKVDPGHDDCEGQECKDGRSRTWMILLYEDSTDMDAFKQKLADLDWNYAGRVHDQEGKLHHHIVVLFKDGRKNADIANDLGIEKRWLRAWDRQKKALRYLCHKDNPDKYQYSTDGIYGTIAEKAVAACSKGDQQSEKQSVDELLQLLDEADSYISYKMLLRILNEKGLYSVFRRMGGIGVRLLDEHNARFLPDIKYVSEMATDRKRFNNFLERPDDVNFADRCSKLDKAGLPPKEEF